MLEGRRPVRGALRLALGQWPYRPRAKRGGLVAQSRAVDGRGVLWQSRLVKRLINLAPRYTCSSPNRPG
jgi:hypothetical protein